MGVLAATLIVLAPLQEPAAQDPAVVVRHAMAAVEGDSASVVERRWTRARSRSSTDRIAALGLATLAHATYRDSIALDLYRVAMTGPSMDRIGGYAGLGMARLLAEREQWPRADSIAIRAIAAGRALQDSALIAEALVTHARVSIHTLGPDSARATLAEAIAVAPGSDLRLQALAHWVSGLAASAQRDRRGSLNHYLAGASVAERGNETRIRSWCDFAAGAEYDGLFRSDSALQAYDRAVAGFRRARDRAGLAHVLRWRAEHHRLYGELGRARADAEETVLEAEATGSWDVAPWGRVLLSQIALNFGDLRLAVRQAAEATRTFAEHDNEYGLVVAPVLEANLALAQGDAASARTGFEGAVVRARSGWQVAGVSAWTGLAWTAVMAKDSSAARVAVDSALPLLVAAGMPAHTNPLSFLEGTIALRFGRLAEAERIFRARLASQDPSQGSRFYVTAARLAEVLVRRGQLDEAERVLHTASEQFDNWRQTVDDRQLRLVAFQLAADMSDPDLGVATVIAALVGEGRVASAFELVERVRARDLADRLNRAAALDTISKARAVRGGSVIALDSAMRALPDDSTAILEYVTGRGDPTTLFVITRRHARAWVLAPEDSLAQPIVRFSALLESGEDPRVLGRELASQMLAPALADLDPAVKRLIVVPDGPLNRLPFDALVLPDGRFVLERFAVATAPATSVAVHLLDRHARAGTTGLVVLADPQFARETRSANNAEVFRSALGGGDGLPRLLGSGREARAIARYASDVTVLQRKRASEAWLKSAPLEHYAVVHFATHAFVDEGSMTNTALALAPAGVEDGFIHPAELANLSLAADLVVLSACRTAGGPIVRGEGIQGLAAPLLAAGARSVAATWWPIGDVATVNLVTDFYREMAAGQNAGDALRAAKLAALKRGAPARQWAAFTLVGDPLARPPLRPPSSSPIDWKLIVAAILTSLAIYGVVMRRRRMSDARLPSGNTATTHHR